VGVKLGYRTVVKVVAFRRFLGSQVLTNLSDGLFATAAVLVATTLDFSAAKLGVLVSLMTISRGFLGPVGGVISDRVNLKHLLVTTEVLRAAGAGLLFALLALGLGSFWVLVALGTLVSAGTALAVPATKSLIPRLVDKDELQLANGLVQAVTWPAYFLGSGVLALLVLAGLQSVAFLVVALFFVGSSTLLALLPERAGQRTRVPSRSGLLREVADGYHELRTHPVMHTRVLTYGVFTFLWRGSLQVLIPLAVLTHLRSPAWVYGALIFVNGASELAANLVIGRLRLRRPLVFTFGCELVLGAALLGIAGSFQLPVPEVGLFLSVLLIGVAAATVDIPLTTVVQQQTDEQYLGKVMSYWVTIGSTGGAAGTFCFGLYYGLVPIQLGTLLLGLSVLALGALLLTWAGRRSVPGLVPDGAGAAE
jgi:MFS transporter, DHA3 family, macrolide efflux protein